MARPPEEKAAALAIYHGADGNKSVKKTARLTGIPEQTIRDWVHKDIRGQTPEQVSDLARGVAGELAARAEAAGLKGVERTEDLIDDSESVKDVAIATGIMLDKAMKYREIEQRGLPQAPPPSSVVDPQEAASVLGALIVKTVAATLQRHAEIIDIEAVELPPGLPAPVDKQEE